MPAVQNYAVHKQKRTARPKKEDKNFFGFAVIFYGPEFILIIPPGLPGPSGRVWTIRQK
jgi:hypothetical protein